MTRDREPATERLASYLEARADELDLDWTDVAEEAGIAVETLRAIRRGKNLPSRGTRRGLDRALKWELGSVTAILAGDEPTPLIERDPEVRGEDESGVAWRDRQYRRWRDDRDKGPALDQIFRTWDDRSA